MGPTCIVDVRVQTEDGTALAGREYTAFNSTVQLHTNQLSTVVNLNIGFPDNQVWVKPKNCLNNFLKQDCLSVKGLLSV